MSTTPRTSALQSSFSQFRDGDLARLWDFARALEVENQVLTKELAQVTSDFQAACDHEWEKVDASFSHEFGTEVIRYQQCEKCGKQREWDDGDEEMADG